uniref:Uncharacterized protein n=2 Tax=Fagus sylvatica TaxID=28930 RepID=A0A2N9H6W8_FAGSY
MDDPSLRLAIMGAAASVFAVGIVLLKELRSRSVIPREPHVNREYEREAYMNSILYRGDEHCVSQIRMRPIAFYELCKLLAHNNLLQETIHMSIREQVLIFTHTIGHNVRFRVVGGRFYRSIETVHRYFKHVLGAVLKLHKHVIKLPDSDTPLEIRKNGRFYPYFKLGWEGSAHDSRILNDALNRPRGLQIPEGRYYLGDAGYGVKERSYLSLSFSMGVKKDTQKEKDVKNFRWSTPMENLLLEILADEALQGNKPSNIFKPSSYRKVVEAINEKFGVDCSQKHVENRFRTLKGNWNTITELRQKSGFGWDDDLKMITCDRNVYDEAVAARPSHEKFLNKKIEMYDELALVVDMSASNTIDLDNDLEEVSLKKQADSSTQTRSHRKRSHASMLDDTIFKDLSSQMGKIASAIQEASLHRTNFFSNLYEEVMKIEGFEESMLASAFDHLNENEVLARSFMLKSDKLRKQWLDNFFYRNG